LFAKHSQEVTYKKKKGQSVRRRRRRRRRRFDLMGVDNLGG
jgi:hypothetical protein